MTIEQMHVLFNLTLKAQGSHEDFLPEEVDVFLNLAIREFIEERKPFLRENDAALSDLRILVVAEEFTAGDLSDHSNFDFVKEGDLDSLSSDFEYIVGGQAQVAAGSHWKTLLPMSYPAFVDHLRSEDSAPVHLRFPTTIEQDKLLVLYDETDTDLTKINLTYLKSPLDVNLNFGIGSGLPPYTHRQIVTLAVRVAIEALSNTEASPNAR